MRCLSGVLSSGVWSLPYPAHQIYLLNRTGGVPGSEAARITTLHHLPGFWARLVSREAQGEEPDPGEGRAWAGQKKMCGFLGQSPNTCPLYSWSHGYARHTWKACSVRVHPPWTAAVLACVCLAPIVSMMTLNTSSWIWISGLDLTPNK